MSNNIYFIKITIFSITKTFGFTILELNFIFLYVDPYIVARFE